MTTDQAELNELYTAAAKALGPDYYYDPKAGHICRKTEDGGCFVGEMEVITRMHKGGFVTHANPRPDRFWATWNHWTPNMVTPSGEGTTLFEALCRALVAGSAR